MTSYAASLTGSKGKILEPETITVGLKKVAPASSSEPNNSKQSMQTAGKASGKKGAPKLSKAQQIIADNKEKKGGAEFQKAAAHWSGAMKRFDELSSDEDRYTQAKSYLNGLNSASVVLLEGDINVYLLQSLLNQWLPFSKAGKKSEGYHIVALMWTLLCSISSSKAVLTKGVASVAIKLGSLLAIEDAVGGLAKPTSDQSLSFTFKFPVASGDLSIEMDQREFQLLYCGPYMDRHLDAKPDSRVSSFVPDGWQRKVLDELDADNSVFVVAPTSAGKTFISFYAMEKVLRADDDGVLVYVS
jgi:hypothetical protein